MQMAAMRLLYSGQTIISREHVGKACIDVIVSEIETSLGRISI